MTENPHIENIFSAEEEACLDLGQMKAYSAGTLVGDEKHYAERHLLNCELCAMAIEGLAELPVVEVEAGQAAITEAAWGRVGERERKRRRGAFVWLSAAAAVILLVTVTWITVGQPEQDNFEEIFSQEYRAPSGDDEGALAEARDQDSNDLEKDDLANRRETAGDPKRESNAQAELSRSDNPSPTMADVESPMPEEDFAMVEEEPLMDVSTDGTVSDNNTTTATGSSIASGGKRFDNQPGYKNVSKPKAGVSGGFLNERPVTTGTVAPSLSGKDIAANDKLGKLNRSADFGDDEFMVDGDDDLDFAAGMEVTEEAEEAEEVTLDEVVISETRPAKEVEQTMSGVTIAPQQIETVTIADARKGKKSKGKRAGRTKSVTTKQPKAKPNKFKQSTKEEAKEQQFAVEKSATEAEKLEDRERDANATTFDQGMNAYNDGRYQEASALLRAAASETPANLQAHFYAAAAFLNINQPQAAIYHLDRILAQPDNSLTEDAQWYKSLAYVKLKERDKARRSLQKVVKKDGKYKKRANKVLKDL